MTGRQRVAELYGQAGAAHQDQLADQLGAPDRGADRGRPAHRVADQAGAAQAERVDEIDQVLVAGVLRVGERRGIRLRGLAEAEHVDRQHVEMRRQDGDGAHPVAVAVGTGTAAVNQDDGLAAAFLDVVGADSARVDEFALKRVHLRSSPCRRRARSAASHARPAARSCPHAGIAMPPMPVSHSGIGS